MRDFRKSPDIRVDPDIRSDIPHTVQSQYSASPVILSLVTGILDRMDPVPDITLFLQEIFDISTARGFGLDVWGRILGMSRLIEIESDDYFGFDGSLLQPFNQAPFSAGGRLTKTHSMDDAAYRDVLMFKALSNISSADAATMNHLLSLLMGGRKVFVLEVDIMTIRVVFLFFLSPWQRALFKRGGLLNKGAGVGYEFLELDPATTFGFSGSDLQPFNQGVFTQGIVTPSQEDY